MTRSPQELAQTLASEWADSHHEHCASAYNKPCDCYQQYYVERRAALAELVALAEAGERVREALRDAVPFLVVPSDIPAQHHARLADVREQVRAALGEGS